MTEKGWSISEIQKRCHKIEGRHSQKMGVAWKEVTKIRSANSLYNLIIKRLHLTFTGRVLVDLWKQKLCGTALKSK